MRPTDDEWGGPYPNKQGEYCGNCRASDLKILADGTVREFCDGTTIGNFRVGKTSNFYNKSGSEMNPDGFVGLYLVADTDMKKSVLCGYREIDTDILLEEVVAGERLPFRPFLPNVPMRRYF